MWVGLPLEEAPYHTGLHVTVGVRIVLAGDGTHDRMTLARAMEERIKPLFPLLVQIDHSITMLGAEHDVPTHRVHIVNDQARLAVEQFYADHYNADADGEAFGSLTAHTTVDTPERAALVRRYLQNTGGVFAVTEALLRRFGEKETLARVFV